MSRFKKLQGFVPLVLPLLLVLGTPIGAAQSAPSDAVSNPVTETAASTVGELCVGYANPSGDLAAHTVQLGCASGFFVDDYNCPEGDLCATWCSLKGAVEVCLETGSHTYCEVVCFYGDCGGSTLA